MKEQLLEMGLDEKTCNEIIEMVNADLEKKDREIAEIKKDYAVDSILNSYNAKTNKAVKALLDMENVDFDEKGNLTGIREQLDKLKEDSATQYLFNTQEFKGTVPSGSSEDIPNKENMNYTQLCAYFDKNGSL